MAKPKFQISCEAKDNKAVIRIDGQISSWSNHAVGFKAKLDDLIAQGIKDADIYINTPGGDCFQANEIGNEIARFPGALTAHLGALCASAGTYIACRCPYVIAAKNNSYMIHKPSGDLYGNSDEIKSFLKLLDNLEKEYINTYSKKTGLTAEEIKKMWEKDYWMDSDESLAKGFIDEIEGEAVITDDDVEAMASYKGAPKITASIQAKPTDNQNTNITMRETVITVLALSASITDAQIAAHLTGLKAKADKADEYKTKIDQLETSAKDEKVEAVLREVLKDKKIVAEQKAFYKKNLLEDFDGTKAILDKMPAATKLSDLTKRDTTETEDRSKWTYADYQEKNPKALAELSETDEPKFKALYKAHFGTEC